MNKIFFFVFRNSFIKKRIFFFLRLINCHYYKRIFKNDFSYLENYPYINIINSLEISLLSEDEKSKFDVMNLCNLKKLKINSISFDNPSIYQSLTSLSLNSPIKENLIKPKFLSQFQNLKKIKFYPTFNQKLTTTTTTTTTKTITTTTTALQPKNNSNYHDEKYIELPNSITSIQFYEFSITLESFKGLPPNLIKLIIKKTKDYLNSEYLYETKIKTLQLGSEFNCKLKRSFLPKDLINLKLGDSFNQEILNESLPNSLKTLEIGDSFNQKIKVGVLPIGLESLTLGNSFNETLQIGSLPQSLKDSPTPKGSTISKFNYPPSLEELYFSNTDDNNIAEGSIFRSFFFPNRINNLPPIESCNTLKKLSLCLLRSYSPIPKSVKVLALYELSFKMFNKNIGLPPSQKEKIKFEIPNHIETLIFLSLNFQIHSDSLKISNLTFIEFGSFFNSPLPESEYSYPPSLTSIILPWDYNCKINYLPKNLKEFYFSKDPISSKQTLKIDDITSISYKFSFENILPPLLLILYLPWFHMTTIESNNLPSSITKLRISSNCENQTITSTNLPSNIKSLIITGNPTIISLPSTLSSLIVYNSNSIFLNQLFNQFENLENENEISDQENNFTTVGNNLLLNNILEIHSDEKIIIK
ncbi:hypothetical protein RB653_005879 [Dictyostelium firmibasis]|uniref:FNIP repeat-containing protein n=1 Tax=Dictyostelium firmibasis TaxID=79012 RepID=A0AAN7YZP2_9MYCE